MENLLSAFSEQVASTVAAAAASVVTVHARPRVTSSGVVWAKGLVVTADHAISREEGIHLTHAGGERVDARLKARDSATGIALLEYDGPEAPAPKAHAGGAAIPGHLMLAIGRNADTGVTASMGILSAAGGPWRTWRGGHLDQFLRLDMNLHPGSSGGLVVDSEGKFFGLATDGLSRLSPLAIPVSTLTRVVGELLAKGRVSRGYLGVGLQSVKLASGRGVIVLSVEDASAAERAGLLVGDVVTAIDDAPVASPDDVQEALATRAPGTKIAARIVRGGQNIEVNVELGDRAK